MAKSVKLGGIVMIGGKLYVAHCRPIKLQTGSGVIVRDRQNLSDFYRAESKNSFGKGPWKIIAQISTPEAL